MKRILITGGAGFLGSHLCDKLIAQGHDILCVDNFFTGSRANVAHLLEHPRFELLRHDVTFPLYVEVEKSTTSPALQVPFITRGTQCKLPKPVCMGP